MTKFDRVKKFTKNHAPEIALTTAVVGYVAFCAVLVKRGAEEAKELNELFEKCYQARDFSDLPDGQIWVVPTQTLKDLTS